LHLLLSELEAWARRRGSAVIHRGDIADELRAATPCLRQSILDGIRDGTVLLPALPRRRFAGVGSQLHVRMELGAAVVERTQATTLDIRGKPRRTTTTTTNDGTVPGHVSPCEELAAGPL
jgi:hypothetical protein